MATRHVVRLLPAERLNRLKEKAARSKLMETEGTKAKAPGSGRTIIASLAALGSVVLVSTCCLPMFPFIFAAGAAGSSAFFAKARPFLAASRLSIGFAFYQRWRAKRCQCLFDGAVSAWSWS